MISTVTTTTTTTVTTTSTGLVAGMEFMVIVAVLLLLVCKEYAATSAHPAMQRANRLLMVGVAPLLCAAAMIVVMQLVNRLT